MKQITFHLMHSTHLKEWHYSRNSDKWTHTHTHTLTTVACNTACTNSLHERHLEMATNSRAFRPRFLLCCSAAQYLREKQHMLQSSIEIPSHTSPHLNHHIGELPLRQYLYTLHADRCTHEACVSSTLDNALWHRASQWCNWNTHENNTVQSCYIPYSGKFSRAQIFARITNKHARKKISRDFYFRDKVTISDHTPYNFPHGNGDPQRVFQRQNDSKTLARLSKRVGRCRGRTAMPKEGS